MKRIAVLLTVLTVLASFAGAQTIFGTQTRIGNATVYSDSRGNTGTSMQIGNQTYGTHRDASGTYNSTQTQIGNQTVYQNSRGTTGNTMQVGNQSFSTYRNGGTTTTCTSNRIGNQVFTNCR